MTPEALREALAALAVEAGMEVRAGVEAEIEPGLPLQSGACRVRGVWWVVLNRREPPEAHVRVLAAALREHASEFLAQRWLAPALREQLEPPA